LAAAIIDSEFANARAGEGVGQRRIVEGSPVPLAVVNASADRLVNLDYFDTVACGNLWEGHCHRLSGLGHAPFWEAPCDFDPILERFLRDAETGRAATRMLSAVQTEQRTKRTTPKQAKQKSSSVRA
jgi:pimeloyl-ACP methyl ester carboxylesterase